MSFRPEFAAGESSEEPVVLFRPQLETRVSPLRCLAFGEPAPVEMTVLIYSFCSTLSKQDVIPTGVRRRRM
jgi:hypothetical protein